MNRFKSDLHRGQKYEIWLNENVLYNLLSVYGNDKAYDIKVKGATFEVKTDAKAFHTNNIGIEFECYEKQSGIFATQADYWVHIIPQEGILFFFNVKELKKYIRINYDTLKKVYGGDDNASRIFLFNYKNLILPHKKIITSIPDYYKDDNINIYKKETFNL